MTPSLTPWKTLSRSFVCETRVLKVEELVCQRGQFPVTTMTRLHFPDWVNIIAILEGNEVALIRQYRHGTGAPTLEIPG
ncbi:hypothetical protein KJ865_14585, partial [Myxococcota bacterium]|nr:hypothetical protein [Myxococcota bacterium]